MWQTEEVACNRVKHSLGFNPQLHAWWHVMMGYHCYVGADRHVHHPRIKKWNNKPRFAICFVFELPEKHIFGPFSQLRASNFSVAISGVKFDVGSSIRSSKAVRTRPGRPKSRVFFKNQIHLFCETATFTSFLCVP